MEMLKEKNTDIERSIYVSCLSSYNNGVLHGKWIKLLIKKPYQNEQVWEFDRDYIQDEINSMLKSSKIISFSFFTFASHFQ